MTWARQKMKNRCCIKNNKGIYLLPTIEYIGISSRPLAELAQNVEALQTIWLFLQSNSQWSNGHNKKIKNRCWSSEKLKIER